MTLEQAMHTIKSKKDLQRQCQSVWHLRQFCDLLRQHKVSDIQAFLQTHPDDEGYAAAVVTGRHTYLFNNYGKILYRQNDIPVVLTEIHNLYFEQLSPQAQFVNPLTLGMQEIDLDSKAARHISLLEQVRHHLQNDEGVRYFLSIFLLLMGILSGHLSTLCFMAICAGVAFYLPSVIFTYQQKLLCKL